MVKKAMHKAMEYVSSFTGRVITPLEALLPSRRSLLKSL